MIDDWLSEEEIQTIHQRLQQGESYLDFNRMSEIIVDSRLGYGHSDRGKQTRFAVITMCGSVSLGKPPLYMDKVQKLRHSFHGVNDDATLQDHFRARLTENVLAVENIEDLNFNDFTSIFNPAFPTSRPAAITAGAGKGSFYHEDEDEDDEEAT
jgi:hypothetical protein